MSIRSIANRIAKKAAAEPQTSRDNDPAPATGAWSTRSDVLPSLHWLRRSRQLSLSDLAGLTGIPMRRLAEYEYTQGKLSSADRERLAEVFGVGAEALGNGVDIRQAEAERDWVEPRTQRRLTAVVATALLSLSLHAPSKAYAHPHVGDDGVNSSLVESNAPRDARTGWIDETETTSASRPLTVALTITRQTGSTPATPEPYQTGTVIEVDGLKITVDEVGTKADTKEVKAFKGYRFVVVTLTAENTTSQDIPVWPLLQMELRDGNGQVYDNDSEATLAGGGRMLPVTVPPLSRLRGTIGYQVPATTSALEWRMITLDRPDVPNAPPAETAQPAPIPTPPVQLPATRKVPAKATIKRVPAKKVLTKVKPQSPAAKQLAKVPPVKQLAKVPPAKQLAKVPPAKRLAKPQAAKPSVAPQKYKPKAAKSPEPAKSQSKPVATQLPKKPAAPSSLAKPGPATKSAGTFQCPVVSKGNRIVITQGYGVGTHAPARTWGAIDLAPTGGAAAVRSAVIVAAHAGTVKVSLNTWPAGNHIWVNGDNGWRTGYSHLARVLVKNGDHVAAGQPIAMLGSTGHSTGPHLDFQVWHNGVNINPTKVVTCR